MSRRLGPGSRFDQAIEPGALCTTHHRNSRCQPASAPPKILQRTRHETHMGGHPVLFLEFKKKERDTLHKWMFRAGLVDKVEGLCEGLGRFEM